MGPSCPIGSRPNAAALDEEAAVKVVFLSWRGLGHPRAGGSEVLTDRLVLGLTERGHECVLVCGRSPAAPGYRVVSSGGTYSQYLRAPLATHRVGPCDLLVEVVNGMPFFTPLWHRGPRLTLVTHVHTQQWGEYFRPPVAAFGSFLESRVMPVVYRRSTLVAISPSTKESLQSIGFDERRIHLVHSGIDGDHFGSTAPKSPEPMFLALGRLAPNKGFDTLLQIWAKVRPVVGGSLVIAGDGPEREELESMAPDGVEFTGRVSEASKRDLLSRAWLLVHAAPHEGWGLVIMEAAAAGTPTLAFDVAGVRDAVVSGVTGSLVRDESSFASEWIALAAARSRRDGLGRAARVRAEEFTWDRTLDEFEKAARAVLGDSR
jgi:glycosyltransferase involved in cell wall biosynthesis